MNRMGTGPGRIAVRAVTAANVPLGGCDSLAWAEQASTTPTWIWFLQTAGGSNRASDAPLLADFASTAIVQMIARLDEFFVGS